MSSRKKFIHQSSLLMGGSLMASSLDSQAFAIFKNRVAPSDQLNIGAIGINGMGWANVKAALKVPGVNLVAVCDVDSNVIKNRLGELPAKKYNTSSIIISHDIYCVKLVANRIVLLIDGKCYAEGTYDELKSSLDQKVKSFFE